MIRQELIRNTAKAYRVLLEDEDGTVMIPMDAWNGADVSYIFEEFLRNGILVEKGHKGTFFMFLKKSPADPKKAEEYFRNKGKPDPNAALAAFCRSRADFYRSRM